MKRKVTAISILFGWMLLLCAPLSALTDTVQATPSESLTSVVEDHRDLRVTIPSNLRYDWETGHWTTLQIYMNQLENPTRLSIAARQLQEQDPPILVDEQDVPILTLDSMNDFFNATADMFSISILDSGETQVDGHPAAYIELLYEDTTEENSDYKVKLTRTVYAEFAYDMLYLAPATEYDTYLPTATSIIEDLEIDTRENETKTVVLGDITFTHPVRNIHVNTTDTSVYLNVAFEEIHSSVYARVDQSKRYDDDFLDNTQLLNPYLLSLTERIIPPNENVTEPTEISRKEIQFHDKRAVRVVYEIYDRVLRKDYYAEATVFVYNGRLYSFFFKDLEGEAEQLHEFAKPILESVRFQGDATAPVAEPSTDTVRWINYANAILTTENGGDIERYPGLESTLDTQNGMRSGLQQWWGITNRHSMDAALTRLRESGHRATKGAGGNDLLGWEYIRAINLIEQGHLIGFYSYQEALDLSLEFAVELQNAFPSWEALYQDYLDGYAGWNHGDPNDPTTNNYKRAELVQGILSLPNGPSSLPYETPLTADWPEAPEPITPQFSSAIGDMVAPIDQHGRPDTTRISAGDTLEFILTGDMFDWTSMDALILSSSLSYGWDSGTNFEDSPVHPATIINSGVSVGFESDTPQLIRSVDIAEMPYPHPDFPDLRTACVKVVFADDFGKLNQKEFESTLYLTLEGTRIPLSEISLTGTLSANPVLGKSLVRTGLLILVVGYLVVATITLLVFSAYRRKKRLAYWQDLEERYSIAEGVPESIPEDLEDLEDPEDPEDPAEAPRFH